MKKLLNAAKGNQHIGKVEMANANALGNFKVNHLQPILENAMVVMAIIIFVWISIQNTAIC
jgi:hypothetical protein